MNSKRILSFLLLGLTVATLLAACGDSTATTAPATTAASTSAATSAAAATTAATSAAATTSSATTAAATSATATTAASTAAATSAAATTAATTSNETADAAGIYPFQKYPALPAGSKTGGNLNWVSLTKQLVPDLHPYPQNVNYTNSWTDISNYLFTSTLLDYDAV